MIPVYKPYLPSKSMSYAHEALNSTWLSHGPYVQKATEKLQELLGVKYVITTNTGSSACHLVAKAHYFKHHPKNIDNIIVPNNVYVAAWNAFFCDDWTFHRRTYHQIDADPKTWNIDLAKLDKYVTDQLQDKDNQLTFLIVHNIGNVINVPELKKKYPHAIFLEDNCEGFLGKYNGKYTGTESFASAISFFGNKNITCGEGGAFICQDEDVYEYIKCLQGQGQSSKKFVHNHLGYNYRLNNVSSAILCGQLEVLPEILERKMELFTKYRNHFSNRDNVRPQFSDINTQHSNWMFGINIDGSTYEVAEKFFGERGVEIRPMFYPATSHYYLEFHGFAAEGECDETGAKLLNKQCIILPSFPELTQAEITYILSVADEYISQI
jgi:perosamine synthetase